MKISSVEKCLNILELLGKNPGGMRILDINRQLDLPQSSIHHILSTLLPREYVTQDPETKKYSLGMKVVTLARSVMDNLDLGAVSKKHLRKLHDLTGETVHLAVLRDKKVIYVEKSGASSGLSLVTYIGFSTDPHAASGGKVMLADLSDEEVKAMYPTGRLKKYGAKTIKTVKDLLGELHKIREQGYALDDEEYYEGVRCVAAPVRVAGKVVAALSITGSVFTMTPERIQKELTGLVKQTAQEISEDLG